MLLTVLADGFDPPRREHDPARTVTTRGLIPSLRALELGVIGACTIVLLGLGTRLPGPLGPGLAGAATVVTIDLLRRELRRPGDVRPVAAVIGVLFVVAVIVPPRFSGDLWSYAMVGRIVSAHDSNPYETQALTFPHDPAYAHVGKEWRHGTTPYGPLFVAEAATITALTPNAGLPTRLAFQASTALALAAALVLLWRERAATAPLVLLGLHPVAAACIVNGGHNDALAGLGLLVAVLFLRRDRHVLAGVGIGAATLVKLTAGLTLLPLAGWTLARRGTRASGQLVVSSLLVTVPATLLVPGEVGSIERANTGVITRLSPWNLPRHVGWLSFGLPGSRLTTAAIALTALVVLAATVAATRADGPSAAVGLAIAAFLAVGAYVLPWYTALALPACALHPRDRATRYVALQAGMLTAAYAVSGSMLQHNLVAIVLARGAAPALALAALAWTMWPAIEHGRRARARRAHVPAPRVTVG